MSENTQKMLLQETDKERLKLWLKKAARSRLEADFLKKNTRGIEVVMAEL